MLKAISTLDRSRDNKQSPKIFTQSVCLDSLQKVFFKPRPIFLFFIYKIFILEWDQNAKTVPNHAKTCLNKI